MLYGGVVAVEIKMGQASKKKETNKNN